MAVQKKTYRKKVYSRNKKSLRKTRRIRKRTRILRNKKSRSLGKKKGKKGGADFNVLADEQQFQRRIANTADACTEFKTGSNPVSCDVRYVSGNNKNTPDVYYVILPNEFSQEGKVYGFAPIYKALKIYVSGKGTRIEKIDDKIQEDYYQKVQGTVGLCDLGIIEGATRVNQTRLLLKCKVKQLDKTNHDGVSDVEKNIVFQVDDDVVCRLGLKGGESCKPLYLDS